MGFQFVHLETFARQDPKGRTVDYVLAEAERQPDACLHVEVPAPPEVLDGLELFELRALHDQRAEAARTTDRTGKTKRVRSTQHSLATVIASHPGGTPEEVARWESLTVAWLRKSYGERLVSVIRHTDEGYPHLHAYLLPDDAEMRARAMHPGVAAKAEAKAAALLDGDDGKTANAKGDKAYKAAMREWQDAYWHQVGLPCGLTRIGPGRRRLTREGWQAEQAQARRASTLDERVDQVAQLEADALKVVSTVEAGEAAVSALRAQVAALRVEKQAVIRAAAEAVRHADSMTAEAEGILSRATRQAATIVRLAKREASALRAFGAAVGGLVWGLVGSSPGRVAEVAKAEEREAAGIVLAGVQGELRGVRRELQGVVRERDELVATVREVAAERDSLRRMQSPVREVLAARQTPTA